ncbi:conserved hypothetical protein [Candidatus Desulfosporosinus infrequens]|uniref:Terminase large subunit n=1 Tax=Candidatus Desulfosporosinus infrequens TaxID=2043169 RepID=A0A2U3LGS3_9FIRM|nr:conserved hypothetical protein [Candidatus Desulfosporosinus infrequens]
MTCSNSSNATLSEPFVNYITEYNDKIQSGEIVACIYVKKAYEKIVDDLSNPGEYHFDIKKGTKPIDFVETLCKQSKGKWIGKPFVLDLWEKAMLQLVYGFVNSEGLRKYTEVLLLVGRKNGKSSLAAALGLYGLVGDGEGGSEVYSVATKLDQSKIIFAEATNIVRQSTSLQKHIKKRRTDLSFPATFSKFEPLSSDGNSLDGLNTHVCLMDELHGMRTRELYDVMKQSFGTRDQPLMWCITTAGFIRESIFDFQFEYAVNVINGIEGYEDEHFLPLLYILDKDDDFKNESVWVKANPGLGTIKVVKTLRENVRKAAVDRTFKNTVLTKDFNVIGTLSNAFLEYSTIRNEETFELEEIKGLYCVGGVDLSSTTDLTSATLLFPRLENKFLCHQMYWMPSETFINAPPAKQVVYQAWIDRGLLTLTPGNRVDYSYVTSWFVDMRDDYNLYIQTIGYDFWNSEYWIKEMENEGFGSAMVKEDAKVIQGGKTLNRPLKDMGADFGMKRINYNKNPMLEFCLCNLAVETDRNANITPVKVKSKGFIDGALSLLDAYTVYLRKKEIFDSLI